jgi:hypothetical protein
MVDANGIPLGVVSAPANRHDSPLLAATLDPLEALGLPPESVSVHLDRGYDSHATRRLLLEERELIGVICEKGVSQPRSERVCGGWWRGRTPGKTLTRNCDVVHRAAGAGDRLVDRVF